MANREALAVAVWVCLILAGVMVYFASFVYPEIARCLEIHGSVVTNIWGMPTCIEGK